MAQSSLREGGEARLAGASHGVGAAEEKELHDVQVACGEAAQSGVSGESLTPGTLVVPSVVLVLPRAARDATRAAGIARLRSSPLLAA